MRTGSAILIMDLQVICRTYIWVWKLPKFMHVIDGYYVNNKLVAKPFFLELNNSNEIETVLVFNAE